MSIEQQKAQQPPKLSRKTKDLSKFTFDFSSESDESQSPQQSRRGNSSQIQRLKMIKPESEEKLQKNSKPILHRDDQQFQQVIELRRSDNPRRLNAKRASCNKFTFQPELALKKPLKQASNTHQQTQKAQRVNSSAFHRRNHNIFDIQISEQEEKPTEKAFFKMRNMNNPEEMSRAELNENYRSDTLMDNQSEQSREISMEEKSEVTHVNENYINPFSPSSSVKSISLSLSKKIGVFKDPNNIKIFLTTPIPKKVVFEFEIHRYKNFMQTEYQLWLRYGEEMSLMAKAINNSIFIEKTIFNLTLACSKKDQKNYFAYLISDFKREIFTLYDHYNYEKPGQTDKILCSIVSVPNFIGIKTEEVYVPGLEQNGQLKTIYNSRIAKNLKKLYKYQQIAPQIRKFKTCKAPQQTKQQLRKQFRISKNTTRHAIIKNQNNQIVYGIFKMQKDRFRVKAGPGISPLHMLSHFVVHLE